MLRRVSSRELPALAQPARSQRPTVLIVDDVEANLVALEALLDGAECEVVRARSGIDALRLLLKREFAVMLLDVHMPEMDGYEVALHARQNPATREMPIIFLTATHDDEEKVLRGYGSGAVDFLFKPLNAPILRSKVRVFLELYNSRRQRAEAKLALERSNVELREAYTELQSTQAQLVHSAKMASLGELVAGIAHEVNNPLAFVLSHLETVRRSLDGVENETIGKLSNSGEKSWNRAQTRLTEMSLGLERIRELVVKLRTFSRLDEGESKRVSVRESVESLLTILGHRLKDRISVDTHFGEPDMIECFPSLLTQAVMNLVANAIDAIEDKGVVSISTGAEGSVYSIVVADTGTGVPAELRDRVMEPFFTTKPVGQGTGLGLSITYSIVKQHSGTLELCDAAGGGTRAVIRIPLSQNETGG